MDPARSSMGYNAQFEQARPSVQGTLLSGTRDWIAEVDSVSSTAVARPVAKVKQF